MVVEGLVSGTAGTCPMDEEATKAAVRIVAAVNLRKREAFMRDNE
jgi:hypothetical protein